MSLSAVPVSHMLHSKLMFDDCSLMRVKVVERHWYEKNKHIFPASRWEVGQFHSYLLCVKVISVHLDNCLFANDSNYLSDL